MTLGQFNVSAVDPSGKKVNMTKEGSVKAIRDELTQKGYTNIVISERRPGPQKFYAKAAKNDRRYLLEVTASDAAVAEQALIKSGYTDIQLSHELFQDDAPLASQSKSTKWWLIIILAILGVAVFVVWVESKYNIYIKGILVATLLTISHIIWTLLPEKSIWKKQYDPFGWLFKKISKIWKK